MYVYNKADFENQLSDPNFKIQPNTIIQGDCLEVMKYLPDHSVDMILTDPPFGTTQCKLHPTQKPVALMEYLIKTYTNENETVLDFTAGSFTTGVACQNTNRQFIGIELDEAYFEIGKNRLKV